MSDLESRFSEMALQVSTMKGRLDNGLALVQKILSEHPKIKIEIDALKKSIENHKSLVESTSQDFSKLKGLVSTIREEFSRNLTTEIKNLVKDLNEKHKMIAATTSDDHCKIQKFESLIEGISLDAKNAVLKANNADLVTTLNKKKVEQVHLMLKNQQLQK